jgi:hypothetical protein
MVNRRLIMIIANFTPDDISWLHEGIAGILKSGQIKEFNDNRGKHILNKMDRKGLLQLNYGDDVEKMKEQAVKIWRLFWTRQITTYNQDNERRKNTQREFTYPPPELEEHAQKLGIELVGPWSVKPTESEELKNLRTQNFELGTQVATLSQQVTALMEFVKKANVLPEFQPPEVKVELSKGGVQSQPVEEEKPAITPGEPEKLIAEFAKLSAERFYKWCKDNKDRVQSDEFPEAVRAMVKEKWERLVKGEQFPEN